MNLRKRKFYILVYWWTIKCRVKQFRFKFQSTHSQFSHSLQTSGNPANSVTTECT